MHPEDNEKKRKKEVLYWIRTLALGFISTLLYPFNQTATITLLSTYLTSHLMHIVTKRYIAYSKNCIVDHVISRYVKISIYRPPLAGRGARPLLIYSRPP